MGSMTTLPARIFRSSVTTAKWVLSAEHRELTRLAAMPRHVPFTTTLLGAPLRGVDGPSFTSSYDDIFRRGIYRFGSRRPAPYIVDCGANIGLSIIYFKR